MNKTTKEELAKSIEKMFSSVPNRKIYNYLKIARKFTEEHGIEKLEDWGKSYIEDYHLSDPFESTIVVIGLTDEKKKFRVQAPLEVPDRDRLLSIGKSIGKKKWMPLIYCVVSQMRTAVVEHESDEKVDWNAVNLQELDSKEIYIICINSFGKEVNSVNMAEVVRDPYGSKYAVGSWERIEGSHQREVSMSALWEGAFLGT